MKNLLHALLSAFLMTVCFSTHSQNNDVKTIKNQRAKSNEAIAKHDTASLASFWLDDVYVLTSRSTSLAGKTVNQRSFQLEFDQKEKVLYVRTPTTVEVFPNWNMASEYGKWKGTWVAKGASIAIGGSYYAKWHKVNGEWKIKAEIYTPTDCSGGDYCKELSLGRQ